MDASLNILSSKKFLLQAASFVMMFVLALLVGTAMRISLLVIYPLVALLIASYYNFRISFSFLLLVALATLSFAASLFGQLFLKYKLLSFFYLLPFLFLLFNNPSGRKVQQLNQLVIFINSLTIVAVVNDIIGLVQVALNPLSDDSFVGLYSQYSISINGLMLINTVLFYYYFVLFLNSRKSVHLLAATFFLVCSFLGNYGAGLIIFIAAFILSFFRLRLPAIIRTVSIAIVSLAIVFVFINNVKPTVWDYNVANIRKLVKFNEPGGARKVISFYNYAISYPRNVKDLLLGSGPGTFNSRSAFMVGSPTYFQMFPFIKDVNQPYYFRNYAYTLWNPGNTQKELYLDGFRNQPFSTVLAFLGEYGLIFSLVFLWLYYRYYRQVANLYRREEKNAISTLYFRFFKFLVILLPLLLLIDNYYEYPEIMLLVIIGIKFAHAGIEQQKFSVA